MAEARFTPGLTTDAVFEHGTEIAEGLWRLCEETVQRGQQGVICGVADIMFLIDAYREALWIALQQYDGREAT